MTNLLGPDESQSEVLYPPFEYLVCFRCGHSRPSLDAPNRCEACDAPIAKYAYFDNAYGADLVGAAVKEARLWQTYPPSVPAEVHVERGHIIYDDQYGHVCTCTRGDVRNAETNEVVYATYKPTVEPDRSVEPTESGSWWYQCSRCGAGTWSGL